MRERSEPLTYKVVALQAPGHHRDHVVQFGQDSIDLSFRLRRKTAKHAAQLSFLAYLPKADRRSVNEDRHEVNAAVNPGMLAPYYKESSQNAEEFVVASVINEEVRIASAISDRLDHYGRYRGMKLVALTFRLKSPIDITMNVDQEMPTTTRGLDTIQDIAHILSPGVLTVWILLPNPDRNFVADRQFLTGLNSDLRLHRIDSLPAYEDPFLKGKTTVPSDRAPWSIFTLSCTVGIPDDRQIRSPSRRRRRTESPLDLENNYSTAKRQKHDASPIPATPKKDEAGRQEPLRSRPNNYSPPPLRREGGEGHTSGTNVDSSRALLQTEKSDTVAAIQPVDHSSLPKNEPLESPRISNMPESAGLERPSVSSASHTDNISADAGPNLDEVTSTPNISAVDSGGSSKHSSSRNGFGIDSTAGRSRFSTPVTVPDVVPPTRLLPQDRMKRRWEVLHNTSLAEYHGFDDDNDLQYMFHCMATFIASDNEKSFNETLSKAKLHARLKIEDQTKQLRLFASQLSS